MKGLSSEGTFSAKEQAELDRKVAKVGNKELANLDARVRSGLQQNTNSMANDIGVRTAAEGAAAFDANASAQLNNRQQDIHFNQQRIFSENEKQKSPSV